MDDHSTRTNSGCTDSEHTRQKVDLCMLSQHVLYVSHVVMFSGCCTLMSQFIQQEVDLQRGAILKQHFLNVVTA